MIDNVKATAILLLIVKMGFVYGDRVRQSNEERIASLERCYKYLAIIKRNEEVLCVGTLLAPRWVLTAAHCCKNFSPYVSNVKITFGVLVWKEVNIVSGISEIIVHVDYNEVGMLNDICLLRLDTPIYETRIVKYAKLSHPQEELKNCDIGFMARLGKDRSAPGMSYSKSVHCEKLNPVTKSDCLQDHEKMNDGLACAKNAGTVITTNCMPDSGGPIMCNNNLVLGVLSKSYGCTKAGYVNVYTKVEKHINFIKQAMNGTYVNVSTTGLRSSTNENRLHMNTLAFILNLYTLIFYIFI